MKKGRKKQEILRSKTLKFRVTEAEERKLRSEMEEVNSTSISSFLRSKFLLDVKVGKRKNTSYIDQERYRQVRLNLIRIGTNLNQLTKVANAEKSIRVDEDGLLRLLLETKRECENIMILMAKD